MKIITMMRPRAIFNIEQCDINLLNRLREYSPRRVSVGDDGSMRLSVPLRFRAQVRWVLRNHTFTVDVPANVVQPLGFMWLNIGFVACMAVMVCALVVMQGFVFRVTVEGVDGKQHAAVMAHLDEIGITGISRRGHIRDVGVDMALMERFDFVAHASSSIRGGRLVIGIHVATPPPIVPRQNLVAVRDAVVTEIVVVSGTPRVNVGDVVRAGAVLVEAAFQIGVEVGQMDEFGFFTYRPIMKETTAVAMVRGRVSESRSVVVATQDEVEAAAKELERELRTANPDIEEINVFGRTLNGQHVVEVVGTWTVVLI